MAKISKSFRLSAQAQEALRQLVLQTGSSETAIVELSLASFLKIMTWQDNSIMPPEPEGQPENFVGRDKRQSVQNSRPQNNSQPYKKKR